MANNNNNKNKNNSSDSLVFGRWPQTKSKTKTRMRPNRFNQLFIHRFKFPAKSHNETKLEVTAIPLFLDSSENSWMCFDRIPQCSTREDLPTAIIFPPRPPFPVSVGLCFVWNSRTSKLFDSSIDRPMKASKGASSLISSGGCVLKSSRVLLGFSYSSFFFLFPMPFILI